MPSAMPTENLDQLAINTIRTLSIDAVQQAKSGHPGTPMALAPLAYTLWNRVMRFDPKDPIWPNRDRFILSANPMGCPACQSPGPATMMHVRTAVALPATREPLTLAGTLRLRPQEGLFYRLDSAEQRWA